jgi:non-ribosomal peptide synthetase component F
MKEIKIEATIENFDNVLDFVNAELETINCPSKFKQQIAIVVEEIFVNIAHYAYTPATGFAVVRVLVSDKEVSLEFEDLGNPYNPLERADPDITASAEDRQIGGLGIFMVKKMMDVMEYQYENNRNILRLKKIILHRDKEAVCMDYAHLGFLKGRRTTDYAGLTIVDLLRRQAMLVPDNTAIVYKDFSISYSNFDRLTDLLSAELTRLGTARGGRVGILVDHNELAPITVLSVMKAGAVYVPLNPRHPLPRIMHMIHDAGIALVIVDENFKKEISEFQGTVVNVRKLLHSLDMNSIGSLSVDQHPIAAALPILNSDDLMVILYTSGSTGNPKGVMLKHGNCIAYSVYYKNLVRLSPESSIASYGSLAFVLHIMDFFPAFIAGASVYVICDDIRLDTGAVNTYLEANHITKFIVPISFGYQFMIQQKIIPCNP